MSRMEYKVEFFCFIVQTSFQYSFSNMYVHNKEDSETKSKSGVKVGKRRVFINFRSQCHSRSRIGLETKFVVGSRGR